MHFHLSLTAVEYSVFVAEMGKAGKANKLDINNVYSCHPLVESHHSSYHMAIVGTKQVQATCRLFHRFPRLVGMLVLLVPRYVGSSASCRHRCLTSVLQRW